MATLNNITTITLTGVATTISLPVTDPYDLYEIKTTSPISIPGTTTINSTGTLVDGLTYTFRYLADITSGNLSIMGETVPAHLLEKDMSIIAYYTSTGWVVDFYPDLSQNEVINSTNLINVSGNHVIAQINPAGFTNGAFIGDQTLTSVIIPPNTLRGASSAEAFKITAWGTCNNVVDKKLTLQVVTGGTTHTLFKNNNVALQGVFKIEAIVSASPPGTFQSEAILVGGDQDSTGFLSSGVNWDYTVNQTVEFLAEIPSATGAVVNLRQLRVEKITI